MTAGDVAAHPIVAALAASIRQSDAGLSFAPEAIEKARASLRGEPGDEVVVHLLALGIKTHRMAGVAGQPVLVELARLVADVLGSAQAAADRFAAAGMSKDAASLLGAAVASRAPEAPKPKGPTVKPKRGLS